MTDYVLGLDLNHYRKDVPLKQAKIQGVRFLIGKCSEGTSMVDETYEPYKLEAKAKSLPFGGYMYWRVIYDAVEQAKHFVDTLGKTEFLPIVDVERYNNVKYGTNDVPLYPVGTMVNHLRIVLNEVERLSGRKPMIYTNYSSWKVLTGNHPMINEYEVWVANYGRTTPLLPVGLKKWTLWQFTSVYQITGYNRGVDANWFNGNEADFERYIEAMNPQPIQIVKVNTSRNAVLYDGINGKRSSIVPYGLHLPVLEARRAWNGRLWYRVGDGWWVFSGAVEIVE